jgi:hypothetical protein
MSLGRRQQAVNQPDLLWSVGAIAARFAPSERQLLKELSSVSS